MRKYLIGSLAFSLIVAGFGFAGLRQTAQASSENNNGQGKAHAAVCAPAKDGVRCHAQVVVDEKGAPAAASAPSGLGPVQFHNAYTSQTTVAGRQIIGIVDAYDDPNIFSDLNTYSAAFGIPKLPACSGPVASSSVPCFQKINQKGGTAYPKTDAGWSLEIARHHLT